MRRLRARLAAACVLAVATAVLTGTALADPGHGNPNAPGQQKQEQTQSAPQQSQQPQSQQPAAQSDSQPGVKPSNTTAHNTSTHAGDKPDVSKRYGNGKTAAQIASSRGAPANTEIKGPGNSQPHKVLCNGHYVDVHAVKSYASCNGTHTTHTTPVVTPTTPTQTTPVQPEEHKVTLCHATGSATNPYVMITVDYHALKEGHTGDKGDIIPPTTIDGVTYMANWDATGQATFNNGCKPVVTVAPAAPVISTTATTTTTTTTQSTTTTPESTPATTATTPQLAPLPNGTTTTTSVGAVLGAHTVLAPKPASHHGVLGTVTHVAAGTLPFTGFPVWLAVLIALALILAGFALRRRTLGTRV